MLTDEQIWNNDAVMSLNAELGLPLDKIVQLARALMTPSFPAKAAGVVSDYQCSRNEGETALRAWSYEIARRAAARAARADDAPSYLPKTQSEALEFVPHEWVVNAIREAVMRTLAAPPCAA